MSATRCEQDLVAFHFDHSRNPLTIGQATVINDAIKVDTTAVPPSTQYSGQVSINLSSFIGMTAVFTATGTQNIVVTAMPNQILDVPITVTLNDCGFDRGGYWQMIVTYSSEPGYANNAELECEDPDRSKFVCRFDGVIEPRCYADFNRKVINVTGAGTEIVRFNLGQIPQCTGPVDIRFKTDCLGISFPDAQPGIQPGPGNFICDPVVNTEPEIPLSNSNINDLVYIDDIQELWTLDAINDTVQRINPDTGALIGTISLTAGDTPAGMIYLQGYNKVYVSASGNDVIRIIDINTLVVTTATGSFGTNPARFAQDLVTSIVYFTCTASNDLYEIDPSTDVSSASSVVFNVGSQPTDIIYVHARRELFVAGLAGNVFRVDVSGTPTLNADIVVPNVFRMEIVNGTEAWLRNAGNITKVRLSDLTTTPVAVSGNGGLKYVQGAGVMALNQAGDEMYLVSTDSVSQVLNTYNTGSGPRELIIIPQKNKIYNSNFTSGTLTPYETQFCGNPAFNLQSTQVLDVSLPYEYDKDYVDIKVEYDTESISCFCSVQAILTYESCNNPNLVVNGNNGTFNGLADQSAFNSSGVVARTTTTFTQCLGDTLANGLRTTLPNPVSLINRPGQSFTFAAVSGTTGSLLWQMVNGIVLPANGRYRVDAKAKVTAVNPIIRANSNIHTDHYVTSGSFVISAEMPWIDKYTTANKWVTIGRRSIIGGSGVTLIPFGKVTTRDEWIAYFPISAYGDIALTDGSYMDWAEVTVKRYYPSECIECPPRQVVFQNEDCDYITELELDIEECLTTKLVDNSDFGFTPGHALSDFTLYRKVTVTLPNGSQQILSSQPPYNILINSASTGSNNPFYTGFPITMGGVYTFTLCNIPTFRNNIQYRVGDNVVLLDGTGNLRFFKSVVPMAGKQPLVATGWHNFWQEISEGDFSAKYCDTQTYVNLCAIRQCIREYKNKLMCSLREICQNNLCDNECLKNYFMLQQMLLVMESEDAETGELYWSEEQVNIALNLANKLCSTCKCQ